MQLGLDIIGVIPALGEPADILNGVISLLRGDCVGAALSFAAAVPVAGWAATGAKWGRTAVKYSDEITAVGKNCLCFTEGTEVLTDQGEKPIEEIDVGDRVLARDEETGDTSYRVVSATFHRQADELVRVDVGADSIEATVEHPFWVISRGWTKAEELRVGELLLDSTGAEVVVRGLEREQGDFTVYNFGVETLHNYFVSQDRVLVHNTVCALPAALAAGESTTHVYKGLKNGEDVYTGITTDIARRQSQHGERFLLEPLTLSPLRRGEARAIEQARIARNQGQNIRNSISPRHSWYQDAVAWGEGWLQANGF